MSHGHRDFSKLMVSVRKLTHEFRKKYGQNPTHVILGVDHHDTLENDSPIGLLDFDCQNDEVRFMGLRIRKCKSNLHISVE